MYFTINQELNIRHKHLNPLWLFEQYVPAYIEDESNLQILTLVHYVN